MTTGLYLDGELSNFARDYKNVSMSVNGEWVFGELRTLNSDATGFFYGGMTQVSLWLLHD